MALVNGIPVQEELVNTINIKSVNSQSLLDSGNLVVNNGANGFQFCEVIPSNGTSVVNSTNVTITYQARIPANTFAQGGILELTCRTIKTGTTSSASSLIYLNTEPSLTGAILIGTGAGMATANLYVQYIRTFRIYQGILGGFPFNGGVQIDNITTALGAESTTTFNLSVDNYILIRINLSSNADTLVGALLKLLAYE